ncbi:sensor histidine kinase [Rugamonas sp. DEMB1]|uniref:PAS domain-containing sensor histidine kinase n=1 Tax=Rugamonas sp. DEMB1 TaxID=3039386 RepID=UPI00244A49C4|nr:HAMP domain-containing sensor histidine kinase [Rugamonas sp. DEMB1]WGG50589.1 HAMP domain-containing sensor histidine kinase [Rugamonas sp. DEMB1]
MFESTTPTDPQLAAELSSARQEVERLRLLLAHTSEVSWMVDLAGPAGPRLGYLSPAARRLFGFAAAPGHEHDNPHMQQLAGQLLAGLPARLARLAAGDQSRRRLLREAELARADGVVLAVEIESTVLDGAEGRPQSLLGVLRDIGPRREQLVQQKKFASMLSHEFRTPLATIDGAIQRLEMTGSHHDEATRKRYRKIGEAVDRLLAMLDDYLSPERMASIGRQRQADEIAPAELLEAVAAAGRKRRLQLTARSVELPARLRCDPNGMRLCLDILLDNAIKYTPDGSAIELLGKKATEGGVEFLVRDHGAGLPADELARVFDKSFRGSNAAAIPGSGLGLYMARAVVEVHGGSLSARNVSESGTEFRIWLPIAAVAGKSLAPDDCSSDNSQTQTDKARGRN